MKKTGSYVWFDGKGCFNAEDVTCESVGKTFEGKTIWKDVNDAYSCYLYDGRLFHPYEPDSSDILNELYGTYVDGRGERVEA